MDPQPTPLPFAPPSGLDPGPNNNIIIIDARSFFAKMRSWIKVLVALIIFYLLLGQWLIGTYYYQAHYIRAALGDDALETACGGVKSVKNPWTNLHTKEWYKLQACLGNEDGFERQGELLGIVSITYTQFFIPSHCSPNVV
jgi:hypothetical protein